MTRFTPAAWHGAFEPETIAAIPTEAQQEAKFNTFADAMIAANKAANGRMNHVLEAIKREES